MLLLGVDVDVNPLLPLALPLTVAEAVGTDDPVAAGKGVPVLLLLKVTDPDCVGSAELVEDAVSVTLLLVVALTVDAGDEDDVAVALCVVDKVIWDDTDALNVALTVEVTVDSGVPDPLPVPEEVPDAVDTALPLVLPVGECVDTGVMVEESVVDDVAAVLGDCDGVTAAVTDDVELLVAVDDTVELPETVATGETDALGVELPVSDVVAPDDNEDVALPVVDGVGTGDGVALPVVDRVGTGDGVALLEIVALPVCDCVSVCVKLEVEAEEGVATAVALLVPDALVVTVALVDNEGV